MMGSLFGIAKDIFSNKASIYFIGIVLVWGVAAGYNWLQKHDDEIVAREEAKQTQVELDRQKKVSKIYADEVGRLMDNNASDQKAMSELATYNETLEALVNESINQLGRGSPDRSFPSACGKWADLRPPSNRQRVLAITFQQLQGFPNLLSECDGNPSRCATEGLRDSLLREPN